MSEAKTCIVEGCAKPIQYKKDQICQMHYFRRMRNGHFGLKEVDLKYKDGRFPHSSGYITLYRPNHPLASKSGLVFEHRFVIYEDYGDDLPPCEFCGKASDWHSRGTHIDHIDKNKSNNSRENLRVLCNSCNVGRTPRDKSKARGATIIAYEGKSMTPTEWARDPRVSVWGSTIRRRIAIGWSVEDALFSESSTFKGKSIK